MTTTMTSAPGRAAAAPWRRISTGDRTVAVTQREALGTTARLAVWPPERAGAAMAAVDAVLAALDLQASRFRPDSEISWLHRSAGGLFALSDGLGEAVRVAGPLLWLAPLTRVGEALISLGYDRDSAAIDRTGPNRRQTRCQHPAGRRSGSMARCWLAASTSGSIWAPRRRALDPTARPGRSWPPPGTPAEY
jgi:hypothetical protein